MHHPLGAAPAISMSTTSVTVSTRQLTMPRKMSLSQRLPPMMLSDISTLMNKVTNSFSPAFSTLPPPVKLPNGELTCWLVDTRSLWPGKDIWSAAGAAEALRLVSLTEQKAISTKMFITDAKMSLASALLKRLFICTVLDIPWKDVLIGRKGDKKHGKPCAVDALGRPIDGIDFNISHQNGLVALIGWDGKAQHTYAANGTIEGVTSPRPAELETAVMVGADIVCVGERDDRRTIDAEGLDSWVDIYDFVFSDEERWSMKYDVDYVTLLDGTILDRDDLGRHDRCIHRNKDICLRTTAGRTVKFNSDELIDAKLRRFYTYFCYKEAYIKLAGEALLAPWLKKLEFFGVRSPKAGTVARCSTHGQWGEEVDDVEVHMHGKEVTDVKMKVQAFEENYMISTAIQGDIHGLVVPAFRRLDLRADILDFAVRNLNSPPSDSR